MDKMADINFLITNIESYVKLSYDTSLGYFRQGGSYDTITNEFKWAQGESGFAVDCQTWAMSVVSPLLIDQWFGPNTAKLIWETTKKLGGYHYVPNTGYAEGVGFTINTNDQVFSGEWSLGAINMLRIFANEYNDDSFNQEAQYMLNFINSALVKAETIDQQSVLGVQYTNKRYWIPFGWWANPLLSIASTAWTVMVDSNYNPFYLGGQYIVNY